jgi:hypothetical protein
MACQTVRIARPLPQIRIAHAGHRLAGIHEFKPGGTRTKRSNDHPSIGQRVAPKNPKRIVQSCGQEPAHIVVI